MAFIDTALSCTSPFPLTYADPDQKRLIRDHLIALIVDFPSLSISIASYTHNDGTTVELLNAAGDLRVSNSAPSVPLTIWIPENYPHNPPIVYVSPRDSGHQIRRDHPFVDSSGAVAIVYLQNWVYPQSDLTGLAHNLIKIFSHHHPLHDFSSSSLPQTPLVSKLLHHKFKAIDRLVCCLHDDTTAITAQLNEEIDQISGLQSEMNKRADIAKSAIIGLEHEKWNLKQRVKQLDDRADVLLNWLSVHGHKNHVVGIEAFEGADEESIMVIDLEAADMALEDLMYALDKALEEGVVNLEVYIRQMRRWAREQFFYKCRLLNLTSSKITS